MLAHELVIRLVIQIIYCIYLCHPIFTLLRTIRGNFIMSGTTVLPNRKILIVHASHSYLPPRYSSLLLISWSLIVQKTQPRYRGISIFGSKAGPTQSFRTALTNRNPSEKSGIDLSNNKDMHKVRNIYGESKAEDGCHMEKLVISAENFDFVSSHTWTPNSSVVSILVSGQILFCLSLN